MSYQETIFHHTCGNSFFHETSPWFQKDWVVAQMVSVCNAGDPALIPGLGRPPGEGNGYPFQYSCLENSMD